MQEKVGLVCRAVRQALELQDNTEYKQGKKFSLPDSSCPCFLYFTSVGSIFADPYPHHFKKLNPHQSKNSGALEALNGAIEGHGRLKEAWRIKGSRGGSEDQGSGIRI